MTEAMTRHTPGTPCWASLLVYGLADCQEFYHRLFGWEFRRGPQQLGPYARALAGGHEVAGMGELGPGRQHAPAWLPYLATDDADTTTARISECGGTVAVGPMDAEEEGRMAIASDPAGAPFGVWQAGLHIGLRSAAAGSPGTPVWYELDTHDTSSARTFYPAVFGHEPETMATGDDFDYTTLHLDGRAVAGVHGVGQEALRGRGPHWKTYFAVEDTDAAADETVRLGGRVLVPPHDSPYGRLASVADPEGARFDVIRTKRKSA